MDSNSSDEETNESEVLRQFMLKERHERIKKKLELYPTRKAQTSIDSDSEREKEAKRIKLRGAVAARRSSSSGSSSDSSPESNMKKGDMKKGDQPTKELPLLPNVESFDFSRANVRVETKEERIRRLKSEKRKKLKWHESSSDEESVNKVVVMSSSSRYSPPPQESIDGVRRQSMVLADADCDQDRTKNDFQQSMTSEDKANKEKRINPSDGTPATFKRGNPKNEDRHCRREVARADHGPYYAPPEPVRVAVSRVSVPATDDDFWDECLPQASSIVLPKVERNKRGQKTQKAPSSVNQGKAFQRPRVRDADVHSPDSSSENEKVSKVSLERKKKFFGDKFRRQSIPDCSGEYDSGRTEQGDVLYPEIDGAPFFEEGSPDLELDCMDASASSLNTEPDCGRVPSSINRWIQNCLLLCSSPSCSYYLYMRIL